MKKIIIAFICALFLTGCSKDSEVKTGSLEVTLSYYYNAYQGYKPDVDAKVYLFKGYDVKYKDSYSNYATGSLRTESDDKLVFNDFKAVADVNGKAVISNIPYGKYLLVVSSKGRFVYSKKIIEINSDLKTETKNFGYKDEFDDDGESW